MAQTDLVQTDLIAKSAASANEANGANGANVDDDADDDDETDDLIRIDEAISACEQGGGSG